MSSVRRALASAGTPSRTAKQLAEKLCTAPPRQPSEEEKAYLALLQSEEELLMLNTGPDVYDFTPFLPHPAVQKVAEESGNEPLIIHIPETSVPSPFAPNIAPATIRWLHNHWCGGGGGTDPSQPSSFKGSAKRGRELWLSWKRAWDLWNGYYIEGRENPVWIRREYERQLRIFRDERKNWHDVEMAERMRRVKPRRYMQSNTPMRSVWVRTGGKLSKADERKYVYYVLSSLFRWMR